MDREKVIKGLELSYKYSNVDENNTLVSQRLILDAIEALKEQETEWEHLWDAPDGTFKGRCKKCGFVHLFVEGRDIQYKFCPECGREVKRDER